jgi:hypothetical protein
MHSLLQPDFYLIEGDKVRATIQALNSIDFSYSSLASGEALV